MRLQMKVDLYSFDAEGPEHIVLQRYKDWRELLVATHPELRLERFLGKPVAQETEKNRDDA